MTNKKPPHAPLFTFEDGPIEFPPPRVDPLIHSTYLSIDDQLQVLAQWGRHFPQLSLPCTEGHLKDARLRAAILDDAFGWTKGRAPPSYCLVMVPYLGSTVATFRFLRARLYGSQQTRLSKQPRLGPDDEDVDLALRLLPRVFAPHHRLRVEMIDLAYGWKQRTSISPIEHIDRYSAHAGVLAAFAIHLPLIPLFDGDRVPHPILGGYELTVSEQHPWRNEPPSPEPWRHAPMLIRSKHDGCTELIARRTRALTDRASIPRILPASAARLSPPHD